MKIFIYFILAIVTCCLAVVAAIATAGKDEYWLVFTAFACSAILMLPQILTIYRLKGKYDFFQPINFIIFLTMLGVSIQTMYFVSADETVRNALLLGKEVDILEKSLFLIIIGLLCLLIGYHLNIPAFNLEHLSIIRNSEWSFKRFKYISIVMLIISFISLFYYLNKLGLWSSLLSNPLGIIMTKKRFVVEGADYKHGALKYVTWGASLLSYIFYFLMAWLAKSKYKIISKPGILIVTVGIIASLIPMLSGSRTGVVILVVNAVIIWNYLRKQITRRDLCVIIAIVLVAVSFLGGLRAVNQGRVTEMSEYSAAEAVLEGRRWLNIIRTAHIIDGVPRDLDYQYGKTMLTWVVAPIPRRLWLEKPMIRVGPLLGGAIFNQEIDKTGVPPGFMAELYLNFGIMGIPTGMLFLGIWLKFLYNTFRNYLTHNKNAILLYQGIMFPFSFKLLSSDLSGIIINVLMDVITVTIVLIFINKRSVNKNQQIKV